MSIVRIRPLGFDDNGDPIEGEPDRLTLEGAFVAPRSSTDVDDRGRAGLVVGWSLFGQYGADVLHSDQIELTDEPAPDGIYEVDGDAGQWKNPLTGWEAGSEVALVRALG
jgi:hypothetical protein